MRQRRRRSRRAGILALVRERGPVVEHDVSPELREWAFQLRSPGRGQAAPAAGQRAAATDERRAPPRAFEWRLTFGRAASIALSALVVVFGVGVAVGRLVLPASTVRSLASTSSPKTQPSTAPAPTPVERAPLRDSNTAAREIGQPQATTRKATHEGPRAATRQPPISSRLQRNPPIAATPARAQQPKSSAASAEERASKTVRPLPNGGYLLPAGRFQISSNGHTIVNFTLDTRCAGSLTLPPIRVGATGTFAFAGHPAGPPPGTTVRVRGHFVSPAEARGTTQVIGTTCRTPTTAFVARVS
jgi:hypothetical protein